MGIKLTILKCPSCGQVMSGTVGPNWVAMPNPAGKGTVVVLSCMNIQCGYPLGTYLQP